VTHRGPCQPPPFCDSVLAGLCPCRCVSCSTDGLHDGLPYLCLHVISRSDAADLPPPHHVPGCGCRGSGVHVHVCRGPGAVPPSQRCAKQSGSVPALLCLAFGAGQACAKGLEGRVAFRCAGEGYVLAVLQSRPVST